MQRFALAFVFALVGSAAQAQVFVPDIMPLDGTYRPVTGTWTYPQQPQQPVYQPTPHPVDDMPIYKQRLQQLLLR